MEHIITYQTITDYTEKSLLQHLEAVKQKPCENFRADRASGSMATWCAMTEGVRSSKDFKRLNSLITEIGKTQDSRN